MPSKKILVVEDNPDWQARIRDRTKSMGYEAVMASSAIEALAKTLADPQDIALILVDPSLTAAGNDREGLTFVDQLRERGIQTPFVLLTAHLTKELAKELVNEYDVVAALEKVDFLKEPTKVRNALYKATGEAIAREILLLWAKLGEKGETIEDFQAAVEIFMQAFGKACKAGVAEPTSFGGWIRLLLDTSHTFENTFLPDKLPFWFHHSGCPLSDDLEDLHQLVAEHPEDQKRIVLPLWCDQKEISRIRVTLRYKFQQAYAIDAVALDTGQMQKIVGAARVDLELQRAVLAQISLLRISPYEIAGPTDERMFFGRERELRRISDGVQRVSFAVTGGRLIGKTSILFQLHRVRLPSIGFHTLYHDCSTTPTCDEFLVTTIRDQDWRPGLSADAPHTFDELLQSPPADVPLVLLLDEADKIVPADRASGWHFFNILRALAYTGRIQVVLSGEHELREALKDSTSPLFNFANEILLGPLDSRAVEELITQPMRKLEIDLVDEAEIVQRIYTFTSGHPSVVQHLCRRLIEQLHERDARCITLDNVNAVIENTDFIRKDFLGTYFSRASTLEHLCALLMAADANLRTLTSVYEALAKNGVSATLNQVDAALERMVDLRNILDRTPEGYDFAVAAFPVVVSKSKRLPDWIALRREVFAHAGDIEPETAPPELKGRLW